MSEWLAAADVLDRLGLKPQTLYAYVSRGLLAARPAPVDSRRSLYRAEDVAALAARRSRSRRRSEVAAGAMTWGEPVLSSAISTVRHGRPWYRGRDVLLLAEIETLESVARLLRGGDGVTLKRADRPVPPAAGPPFRGPSSPWPPGPPGPRPPSASLPLSAPPRPPCCSTSSPTPWRRRRTPVPYTCASPRPGGWGPAVQAPTSSAAPSSCWPTMS